MGRRKDDEIIGGLAERLSRGEGLEGLKVNQPAPLASKPPPEPKRRPSVREGMSFAGFYVNEDQKEKLRVLAFETRRGKQDLLREALNMLFKKHGIEPSSYETGKT